MHQGNFIKNRIVSLLARLDAAETRLGLLERTGHGSPAQDQLRDKEIPQLVANIRFYREAMQ